MVEVFHLDLISVICLDCSMRLIKYVSETCPRGTWCIKSSLMMVLFDGEVVMPLRQVTRTMLLWFFLHLLI